ncbi:hypothetical protein [Bradyrhizobium sp. McL0616]|uniref:hypothetical protein n=1 Tax=Bradyrhizobium sp. McL0616 TaxID=3415674 RepID=UPI003CEE570A
MGLGQFAGAGCGAVLLLPIFMPAIFGNVSAALMMHADSFGLAASAGATAIKVNVIKMKRILVSPPAVENMRDEPTRYNRYLSCTLDPSEFASHKSVLTYNLKESILLTPLREYESSGATPLMVGLKGNTMLISDDRYFQLVHTLTEAPG